MRDWWRGAGVVLTIFLIYKFIMKEDLIYVIERNLSGDEAAVLRGILLGDKSGFRKSLYENLKTSGLVHLMVASGSNVMLLSRWLIEGTARWWGRKWAIGWGLGLIWGYAAWVGWEAPIMRAGLLMSIYYWAQLLGRRFNLWRAIILTVGLMLVIEPDFYKSVSFWLSMVSFGAIVGAEEWKLRLTGSDLGMTVWVSLAVTPILALVFGKISLVAPVSNVAVLFLVEAISVMGVIGLVGSVICLDGVVFWILEVLLGYVVRVAEWTGGWGWSVWEFEFNWWMVVGWYGVMVYWVLKRNVEKS